MLCFQLFGSFGWAHGTKGGFELEYSPRTSFLASIRPQERNPLHTRRHSRHFPSLSIIFPILHDHQHRSSQRTSRMQLPSPPDSPMLRTETKVRLLTPSSCSQLSDNNDFCSACAGNGLLLCCDGCDRSFHFGCLDPPLDENSSQLNEPWFCFVCVAKRPVALELPEKTPRGIFAPLLVSLRKRNPCTFALPQDVREFYDGVATDRSGAFIEAQHTRTR